MASQMSATSELDGLGSYSPTRTSVNNKADGAAEVITKVDLRGVEPGAPGWEEAQAMVTASMVAHGFVVVAYGGLELGQVRHALFGTAFPELFALPLEAKQRTMPNWAPVPNYLGKAPGHLREALLVGDADDAACVRKTAHQLWPQGNPAFCDTIVTFAEKMVDLQRTVEKMTLEGLGKVGPRTCALAYALRLSHYGVPAAEDDTTAGGGVSLMPHGDDNMFTVVVQHEVEGLEVLAKDGTWGVVPYYDPHTFIFLAGKLFTVLTNGHVPTCIHRVRMPTNRERLSAQFICRPRHGVVVSAMDEFVDAEHPLLYNPCDIQAYDKFCLTEEGSESIDTVKAFCGVRTL